MQKRIYSFNLVKYLLIGVLLLCQNLGYAQIGQKAPSGVIYFVEEPVEGKSFLCSINADGTGKAILSKAYHYMSFPKVCAATGMVGFTNKTENFESEVYLMVRRRATRILTEAKFEDFSPSGDSFLWVSTDGKGELNLYNIKSKRSRRLAKGLRVATANWSLDGEWIVVSAITDYGTTDLYLISAISDAVMRITDSREYNESYPVFCSDGKTILYLTDKHGGYEMEYMAVEVTEVYRPGLAGLFPTLSKNDEWVAYEEDSKIKIATKTGFGSKILSGGRTPFWLKK